MLGRVPVVKEGHSQVIIRPHANSVMLGKCLQQAQTQLRIVRHVQQVLWAPAELMLAANTFKCHSSPATFIHLLQEKRLQQEIRCAQDVLLGNTRMPLG